MEGHWVRLPPPRWLSQNYSALQTSVRAELQEQEHHLKRSGRTKRKKKKEHREE